MNFFRIWLGILFFLLQALQIFAVPIANPVEQARNEYICALVSMASYNGHVQELALAELAERGWVVQRFRENTEVADAKFYMVRHQNSMTGKVMNIISITGTESKKDVKSDLRFDKIPFGGTTQSEFEAVARQKETPDTPMVHRGFEEYTRTAFFTQPYEDTKTVGEIICDTLKARPDTTVYLTGHSLGGAVATLLAARLLDMGIPTDQLQVITFGAPAVGNEAFARVYGDRMQLDRVVIKYDPVKGILQTVTSGYKQFGRLTEWERNPNSDHFEHDSFVYGDAALRNYYDRLWESGIQCERDGHGFKENRAGPGIYAAPLVFNLDEAVSADQPYMEASLKDGLRAGNYPVVFAAEGSTSLSDLCRAARQQGCTYVLLCRVGGKLIRDQKYNFRMSLHIELYDTKEHLVTAHDAITDTGILTPIEALLYNQVKSKTRIIQAMALQQSSSQ